MLFASKAKTLPCYEQYLQIPVGFSVTLRIKYYTYLHNNITTLEIHAKLNLPLFLVGRVVQSLREEQVQDEIDTSELKDAKPPAHIHSDATSYLCLISSTSSTILVRRPFKKVF
jgi:hypothetical protein